MKNLIFDRLIDNQGAITLSVLCLVLFIICFNNGENKMKNPVNVCNKHYYLDILNIIAVFAVVLLHTSDYAFDFVPNDSIWYFSVFIQVLFIWAVPIFFMILGANLLNYRERYDTKTFLKKRAFRVLLPFVTWSIIWYVWNHFVLGSPDWSLSGFLRGIEQNQIQPIFWFFY